jgi:predicted Zn-dependent protease
MLDCSVILFRRLQREFTSGYNEETSEHFCRGTNSSFGNSGSFTQIALCRDSQTMSTTDKIAGLKEILALDPKNSFARYGIAMELANRGEVDAALKEFDVLIEQNSDYVAAYFMSAQTLAKVGRNPDAVEKLKAGIACAARTGNRHALSEMQQMLDELDR